MTDAFDLFRNNVNKEIESLSQSVPTLWAVQAQYDISYHPINISFHLTKEVAIAKKPKDYAVFYGSGEESATYCVIEVETKKIPIERLVTLFM